MKYIQGLKQILMKDFLKEIDEEIRSVIANDFSIEVIETNDVPSFDDPDITYDNLDKKIKKCKKLESCVLYVDIRDSTQISAARRPATLAKKYSSFVKSMIAAARYSKGHVRNIIGDRVMVVFDKENCFSKAVDTAILMNSISRHILNKHIKAIDFKCGIGIDYGTMLIAKAGAVRQGAEKEFYRSLVWLGNPANVASKLTDVAYKTTATTTQEIHRANYYPFIKEWLWHTQSLEDFVNDLEPTYSRNIRHKDEYFYTFSKRLNNIEYTPSPILMTEAVYEGLKKENPSRQCITNNWLKQEYPYIKNYDGNVFGGDIIFTAVREI